MEMLNEYYKLNSALNICAWKAVKRYLRYNLVNISLEDRKKLWLLLTDTLSNKVAHSGYYSNL